MSELNIFTKKHYRSVSTRIEFGGSQAFSYCGISMSGTFAQGDIIFILPVSFDNIRVGDIVVFKNASSVASVKFPIVHRVCKITTRGLITKGDACSFHDSNLVSAEMLIGRVSLVQRQGKKYRVRGGYLGKLWAYFLRLYRGVLNIIRIPYRCLRKSGIVRYVWRPPLKRIDITQDGEILVKYTHRGHTVAKYCPQRAVYWCRKPYDLILSLVSS